MYSAIITDRFLEAQRQIDPTFRAARHALVDVDTMIDGLRDAWDPETHRQTRKLTRDEVWFIENERLVCTHDFEYFSTRYCWIIDYTKRLARFRPNVAQKIVLDLWGDMEAKRWAIMMLQLKARQLGVSTLTELAVLHRLLFWTEVDAVVASSTPDKSGKMAKMIRTAWDHLPWWLQPTVTKVADGLPIEWREQHTALEISAGNKFSGVARGSTPNVFHGSEVCEWSDPRSDIDAALLNAVHETPEVFFIIESTALGRGNWFHYTWNYSKEHWEKRGSKLCPIFLPFYVGRDIYPDDGWLSKHPVPDRWQPTDRLIKFAARCEAYVQQNTLVRTHLGQHWVMPKEQLWWYDFTSEEYRAKDELNTFLAECCADDMDAFQSTNRSAFATEVVLACRDRIKPAPVGVYKLMGVGSSEGDIPIEHWPDPSEIDKTKEVIPIDCFWGRWEGHYQLVPVKFEGYSASSALDRIFIYKWPEPGRVYGYGADLAEGIGADRSVLEFVEKDTLLEPDQQVCEFASASIGPIDMWPWCMALGTLYSPMGDEGRQQAKASIEVRLGGGDGLQYELRKRGWANFLVWPRVLDSKKVDMSRATKLGFVTNAWSRPNALAILFTWIKRDRILINSPYFIEEMEAFEKDEDRQAIRAAYGEHDDRIMALAFILFAFHLHEIHSDKITTADLREQSRNEPDPVWDPGEQGRDLASGPGTSVRNWDVLADLYPLTRH